MTRRKTTSQIAISSWVEHWRYVLNEDREEWEKAQSYSTIAHPSSSLTSDCDQTARQIHVAKPLRK